VSEVICPQCGNKIEYGTAQCPHCGTGLRYEAAALDEGAAAAGPQAALLDRLKPVVAKILATTRTHKWYWAGGGGGAFVVAVLAVLFLTGVFGPSGRAICTAALTQAKDFGVISPSATLSSSSAESTDVKDRRKCTAQADNDTYVLQADLQAEDAANKKCSDFKKQAGCVKLYSVARSDGMTTYQVREIPPGETDAALLGQSASQPGSSAAPDSGDASGLEAPTAVDNAPAAPPPDDSQPQQ